MYVPKIRFETPATLEAAAKAQGAWEPAVSDSIEGAPGRSGAENDDEHIVEGKIEKKTDADATMMPDSVDSGADDGCDKAVDDAGPGDQLATREALLKDLKQHRCSCFRLILVPAFGQPLWMGHYL